MSVRDMVIGGWLERPARWVHDHTKGMSALPPHELATIEVGRRVIRPDSIVVDAGANRGRIMAPWVPLLSSGRLFAIEPIPFLAASLRRRYRGNDRVVVEECALGSQPGLATFYEVVTNREVSSLFVRPDRIRPGDRVVEHEVPVRTLDRILAGNPVDLLKIDVEGAELPVLEGAAETIKRFRPVIVIECGDAIRAIAAFLEEHGMTLSVMSDWLGGTKDRDAVEAKLTDGEFQLVAHPM